jgi:hypothetical protein
VDDVVGETHEWPNLNVKSMTIGGKYIRHGSVHVTYMSAHWGWVSRQIDTRLEMAGLQESSLLPKPQCSSSRGGLIEKTIYCRVPADTQSVFRVHDCQVI